MEFELFGGANAIVPEENDSDDYRIIFSKCLKKLRLGLGISLKELSENCYLSKNLLTKFETGTVSDESFYANVMPLIRLLRRITSELFGADCPAFEWLYITDDVTPFTILCNKNIFDKFLNAKFGLQLTF